MSKHSFVAQGLIEWLGSNMDDSQYYVALYDTECFSAHLDLLCTIGCGDRLHRTQVLNVISRALRVKHDLDGLIVLELCKRVFTWALSNGPSWALSTYRRHQRALNALPLLMSWLLRITGVFGQRGTAS